MRFLGVLLYNLMVCWHDIKHKLHVIVALHVTKVIKMITGVMQPTYNPILVRILNKIRFCAKPLITLGVGPLKKEVSHMRLSPSGFKSTGFRRQTELEAEILTGIRSRSEMFIFEVFYYLGRTALGSGYPIRLVWPGRPTDYWNPS